MMSRYLERPGLTGNGTTAPRTRADQVRGASVATFVVFGINGLAFGSWAARSQP
ncbi:hypothetical protein ACVWY0_002444 [Arthrobacter sp. UYNi723]